MNVFIAISLMLVVFLLVVTTLCALVARGLRTADERLQAWRDGGLPPGAEGSWGGFADGGAGGGAVSCDGGAASCS